MEIISLVMTPFAENCVIIKDGNEAMVIDPGEANQELFDTIEGCNVELLVNTHTHIDHVGGNAEVKERTGAELLCHEDAAAMLQGPQHGSDRLEPLAPVVTQLVNPVGMKEIEKQRNKVVRDRRIAHPHFDA